jgi:glutamate-1-semialdehyde 2,1-aminomutase
VRDFASATASNTEAYKAYFHAMLDAGVYLAPSQYEAMFVSIAHSDEDIALTCQAAKAGFAAAAMVM